VTVVNAAGAVQGVVLVTFPAASTIFTSKAEYGLSSTQYGAMFIPQVVTAIAASLAGAKLGERFGTKRVYLAGLLADVASMALLLVSVTVESRTSVAYPLLLAATASLGAGFGLTVPALNTFAAAFHPASVDRAVLVLNALLGLGTVLAPAFVAVFVGLGFWWGLPLTSTVLVVFVVFVSARLPLRIEVPARPEGASRPARIPSRFWVYAAFAVLYGICETVNGNWSQLDMTALGATTTQASVALTAFWGMVTAGRVLFAAVQRWVSARWVYHLLPLVLAGAFLGIAALPKNQPALGVVAFGLAGLGCSALLPLTISFGQEELTAVASVVAAGVIAFYQVGYGIAALGVAPLHSSGIALSTIFGVAAAVALALGALSFVVARLRPLPTHLHPRPAHLAGAHLAGQ
jgi:MFS family permease